jgi:hypothetical protein
MSAMNGSEAEVERLVKQLEGGIRGGANFSAQDGLGAVLTFTFRFTQAIVNLPGDQEQKRRSARIAASTLRRMASEIEFEVFEVSDVRVH